MTTATPEMNSLDLTREPAAPDLPVDGNAINSEAMERLVENACHAADFLKALSHEGRLMILCHLVSGEKSVTELEHLLSSRQAAVSQQLSRLRYEGLVGTRREGKQIYYSLKDERARHLISLVYELFCKEG